MTTPEERLAVTFDKKGHHDISLSKGLSGLLRHNAPKENIKVHPGGFVNVQDILNHGRFKRWTLEDVRKVVEGNDKQRFALREQGGILQIRANQGHSFEVEGLELEEITGANSAGDDPLVVIHGTYFNCWNIIKSKGLSRMKRNHIHFAAGEPGSTGVISGMRNSAQVHIYIDLDSALEDGIKFYRSENNVILSPGDQNGLIQPKHFKKVLNKTDKTLIILKKGAV